MSDYYDWHRDITTGRDVLVSEEHAYQVRPGFYPSENKPRPVTAPGEDRRKPVIFWKWGYWRVRPMPADTPLMDRTARDLWKFAYRLVNEMNHGKGPPAPYDVGISPFDFNRN